MVDDELPGPPFVAAAAAGRKVGESSSSEPSSPSDETNVPSVVFLWDWKRGCGRRKMWLRWRGASSEDEDSDEELDAGEEAFEVASGAVGRGAESRFRGAETLAVRKLL